MTSATGSERERERLWRVRDLGRRDYEEVRTLQLDLVAERQAGAGMDTLLLVEHPHVVTLGRRSSARDNVLTDEMPVIEIERGGDATYHGPGQLVGYPIVRLEDDERDLHAFLRALEEGLIRACGDLGLSAVRREGLTGVWLGDRKVASIGIAVRRWVTFHGFALNVTTDLTRFRAINPCGLDASVMTSLSVSLGRDVSQEEVKPLVVRHLGEQLGRRLAHAAADIDGDGPADLPI
ncbi:MAG TPA: lipoyl(octanoyl) transferase LipB [Polyangia bacterium]|nr:lipoyl(octanoyl) transferase LipB [Polyangia bacterium]